MPGTAPSLSVTHCGVLAVGPALAGSARTWFAAAAILGAAIGLPHHANAQSINLEGAWSGGGTVSLAGGSREHARCRARYDKRSNAGYIVSAVCATASVRASQTASLRKIGENRYAGNFYNRDYDISGTIYVVVRGNTQSVRLTSESGWAALKLSR